MNSGEAGGVDTAGSGGGVDDAALRKLYLRHSPDQERLGGSGPALPVIDAVVASHRRLAEVRRPGTPAVDVRAADAPGRVIVEIVTDDMPFLVDSVQAAIRRVGGAVHRVVHPILVVRRDADGTLTGVDATADPSAPAPDGRIAESWMHLDVDGREAAQDLPALRGELERTLDDVRQVVADGAQMMARANEVADDAGTNGDAASRSDGLRPGELSALLRWMTDDHFTFIGYRYYVRNGGRLDAQEGSGLGVLRTNDPGARIFLPDDGSAPGADAGTLVITRANRLSRVLRPVHPYYVGVRTRDASGEVTGEHRFLGMLTVPARYESVLDIPVVERRIREAIRMAGFPADSHSGQQMLEVFSGLPREELFSSSERTLHDTAVGVLAASARSAVRVFVHPDPYRRFLSCLVYLPRDRYTTATRLAMTDVLLNRLGGSDVTYTAQINDASLALVHFIVTTDPNAEPVAYDLDALQDEVAEATRTWDDRLVAALGENVPGLAAGIPGSYKAGIEPSRAVEDLRRILGLEQNGFDVRLYRDGSDGGTDGGTDGGAGVRFALYLADSPVTLTTVLPILQQLDVEVLDEHPAEFTRPDGRRCWLYDFGLRPGGDGAAVPVTEAAERFSDAFSAAWRGDAESDRFSALVLRAGLQWREAAVLRAYSRYARQLGGLFSLQYTADVLVSHPDVARSLIGLFRARFDPARDDREKAVDAARADVVALIDEVTGLDADRILRGLLAMMDATLRTNWFRDRAFFSFKLDPAAIPDVPAPRPRFEIFVYSPQTEGVHLRFGPVARGGLRYSDRQQDYRTEILGLVKAQAVKNAVIVPVGAKGGFVVRTPSPDAEQVRACYTTFISGLLDVTDNLRQTAGAGQGGTETVPPPDVVRHDGDDSYLVVAADKGTATFSDLANSISAEYGFWLGDAFASGGSVGYDHKAMGITARGAWESVKRHFSELGVDTQRQEFTVVGVGDMSGDVFGNGMLLSEHIRLVAAFDHRHVFIDPTPDAAASYAERRRLFELPRSTWDDYDRSLISDGGGVWPRTAKSVPVGPQMRAALGLDDTVQAMSPPELIHAILLAPADLLWNGGVGTYVKASTESHPDVGDKANDAIRVDGSALRVSVVGEGGNLGLTQRGRIEFARAGGRVNTDAIDNSAGVDCSDHEVNIKILLDRLVDAGELQRPDRDALLASMTDEVGALVLDDNVAQNRVLGVSRSHAAAMANVHARIVDDLAARTGLDRALEVLPDDAGFVELQDDGLGLTSPELATVLAHTKLDLTDRLLDTDLPDRPTFAARLPEYFPAPLRERFGQAITEHPLRREITGTLLVNEMVDGAGLSYAFRLGEELAADVSDAVRAYAVATAVFDLPTLWSAARAADVPVAVADGIVLDSRRLLDRASRWFLTNRPQPLAIGAEIARFADGIRELRDMLPELLCGRERDAATEQQRRMREAGVPEDLLTLAGLSLYSFGLLDVVELVELADRDREPRDAAEVARLYYALSEHLGVDTALTAVSKLARGDRWHGLARLALRDDLYGSLRAITLDALRETPPGTELGDAIAAWERANSSRLLRARAALEEIDASATLDLATLSVISRQLRGLAR